MNSGDGMLVPILVGAVLGGVFVLAARRPRSVANERLFALGLIVAALVYVVFALAAGDSRWLGIEAAGVAIFGAFAWLGLRSSPWWLALGWAAHVGWDVGLHLDRAQSVVGPEYPLVCVGFDLVVAGSLLAMAAAERPLRA